MKSCKSQSLDAFHVDKRQSLGRPKALHIHNTNWKHSTLGQWWRVVPRWYPQDSMARIDVTSSNLEQPIFSKSMQGIPKSSNNVFSMKPSLNLFRLPFWAAVPWCLQAGSLRPGRCVSRPCWVLRVVFIRLENPRWSGISLFPDSPKLFRLIKTRSRWHPRSSGLVGDKSENRERFYFPNVSQIISNIWKFKFVLSGTSAIVLVRYQSPKLLRCSPSLAKNGICHRRLTIFPISRQNLELPRNSEIPDHLGFSHES